MTTKLTRKMVWETREAFDSEEKFVDRLLESPAQRRERVVNRAVDADTVTALVRLWS